MSTHALFAFYFVSSCRKTIIDQPSCNHNVIALCGDYVINVNAGCMTPPFCPFQLSIGAAEVQPRNLLYMIFRGRLASGNLPSVNNTRTKQAYIYQNMSLWVDKYRPTSLGKLDYHKDQAVQLKNLVR